MNRGSNVLGRLILFGTIAGFLIWLGSLKPKIAGSGPAVVVVRQGGNVSFEPQNSGAHTFQVESRSALTNLAGGATNNLLR